MDYTAINWDVEQRPGWGREVGGQGFCLDIRTSGCVGHWHLDCI